MNKYVVDVHFGLSYDFVLLIMAGYAETVVEVNELNCFTVASKIFYRYLCDNILMLWVEADILLTFKKKSLI